MKVTNLKVDVALEDYKHGHTGTQAVLEAIKAALDTPDKVVLHYDEAQRDVIGLTIEKLEDAPPAGA